MSTRPPASAQPPAPGSHTRRSQRSEAIEDYAKAIYAISQRGPEPVSTTELAERLALSPGTVTAMLKKMAALGLAAHEPYRGVRLTEAGERVALEVIRHHRLIEAFLADVLEMPWDRVHDEAEVLEHYISEELEERIAAALGNPDRDPHGDPIPDSSLAAPSEEGVPLATLVVGEEGVFARVSDRDPEMLRFLDQREIRLGAHVRVSGRQPFGGPLLIAIGDVEHAIGEGLAQRMLVIPARGARG